MESQTMEMLSEDDRRRIEAEEIFRVEVRRSFNKSSTSFDKKIWVFLNSSFALWLLSTIAVGGFTTIYTHITNSIDEEKARIRKIRELDLEIEGRLSQFLISIEPLIDKNIDQKTFKLKKNITFTEILNNWETLKKAPSVSQTFISSVFPQYKDTGLISLVVQLRALVKNDEKDLLREVIINITGNLAFWNSESRLYLYDVENKKDSFIYFWNQLKNIVILSRWQGQFPYTDCRNEPFC